MRRAAVALLSVALLGLAAPGSGQPTLLHEVLPSGLRVVVAEQPNSPAVTVDVWVKVGSRDETDELSGAAHFVEHMLFKGTRRRPPGHIAREVDSLGGWINASTSWDYTRYYVVVPAGAWRQAVDIQADALTNPTFDPQEVERERTVVLQELSLIHDTPGRYAVLKLYETAYTVHPYRRPIGGSVEAIRQMTRAQLVDFYRRHYAPANVTVVVAGGVPTAQVLDEVRRMLSRWTRPLSPRGSAPQEPPFDQVRRLVEFRDVRVTSLAMGWLGPDVRNEDHYAMDVLTYALGRGRAARWVRNLRDRRRVVQSVSVSFPTAKDPPLVVVVAVTADPEESRAERAVLEEVRELRERGLSEEELERAKTLLEAEARIEQHTSQGLAASLGFAATVADLEYHTTYLDRVRAVTREDMLRVARQYLDPERYAVVAVRPRRGL